MKPRRNMDIVTDSASRSWEITLRSTEHQSFDLFRYNMEECQPGKKCTEEIPVQDTFDYDIIVLEEPEEKRNSLKALEEKLIHLDELGGAKSVTACLVSSLNKCRLAMIKNKHKVAELLFEKSPENVVKHLKPILLDYGAEPTMELVILTQSEGDFEPLSTMIATRAFCVQMVPVFTKQILSGLRMIHENGIVHKDIRCSNILVERRQTDATTPFTLKIAHFEKAAYLNTESCFGDYPITSPEGSSQFASPEMQQLIFGSDNSTSPVGTATDIFSLGCTVVEMVQRSPPRWIYEKHGTIMEYNFKTERTLTEFVVNLGMLLRWKASPDARILRNFPSASAFVSACLARLPEGRPTSQELETRPFIMGLQM
ncbi:uncharacterized protein LOC129602469 isoform X2 [Paramacrobiotus metropolitanus]|uniref:uncharacterized protein LOC129602469 isoform X2 n=1 Tax=Paramacrobiotus metropolitanus TaxID=2943436 RepID=UPI002445F8AE|nr:uncharacterized protein LOC129602469 isoform X2 [Paramacrobiotus metropolitanus]